MALVCRWCVVALVCRRCVVALVVPLDVCSSTPDMTRGLTLTVIKPLLLYTVTAVPDVFSLLVQTSQGRPDVTPLWEVGGHV